jgi:hypothetical protein
MTASIIAAWIREQVGDHPLVSAEAPEPLRCST